MEISSESHQSNNPTMHSSEVSPPSLTSIIHGMDNYQTLLIHPPPIKRIRNQFTEPTREPTDIPLHLSETYEERNWHIPLEPMNIIYTLQHEYINVYANAGSDLFVPPRPRLRRQLAGYFQEGGLLKNPFCFRQLPNMFQDILEEIIKNLTHDPIKLSRDRLVVCDMIYRETYKNGVEIFYRQEYVPSFVECILSCIIEKHYDIAERCALAYIIARICIDEPDGTMVLKLHGEYVWERMLQDFPCPLLWEIYVMYGGDRRINRNITGEFNDLQRMFIISTSMQ